MPFIKHVGQTIDTNKKCIVVFRSLPGDEGNCLIVETEALPANYHDKLIEAVESPTAQSEMDFYNFAQREVFHDGNNMLQAMHQFGWLKKKQVDQIEMMPAPGVSINLRELNNQLAGIKEQAEEKSSAGVLSDRDIANQMRSQAAFYKKEAQRLFDEAEALDPQTTASTAPQVQVQTVQTVKPSLTGEVKRGRGRPKKK